jgi:hypothetical protein
MSSATLTERARSAKRAKPDGPHVPAAPQAAAVPESSGLRPWHFFLLASAALAAVTIVVMRGQSAPAIVLAALTVAAGGYTAFAVYRTLVPLVADAAGEETTMVAGRTRAALERDKMLTLRAIKELEFDHAMGKIAAGDYGEMRDRLRARALRLIKQLDGADAYRTQIERDVAALLPQASADAARACAGCGARNEGDARFCKMCGQALHASS